MCKNEITIGKSLWEIAAFSWHTPKANDDLFNFKYITGFFRNCFSSGTEVK